MTIIVNSVNFDACPSCGSCNIFANEYGVQQCCDCLLVLESGSIGRREVHNSIASRQTSTTLDKLEDAADFYSYSSRRLYDRIRKGAVLGIEHRDGRLVFHSEANEIKGPLADKPQQVILPPGTKAINVDVCSGSAISGRIYFIGINTALQHPIATLQCEAGYSGPIVQIVCYS